MYNRWSEQMLTQTRLRQVLTYKPEAGCFTWVRGAKAGKVAGTLHDARGFLKVSIDGERHLLHRLAWLWMTGAMPRSNIAHIDQDRSNNRWTNLREGERMQVLAHRAPWRGPTGMAGVWSVEDRFEAMIDIDGVLINLGHYTTATEAQEAIAMIQRRARERQRQKLQMAA
ncbi:HNH endonuclease [Pseudorhodobacter sp.]|uniref:HNH endonuclease n=1 Tax=Pseudorhodobacter sp. TaxID=1934400 RepID=UPI002AFE33B0|nr:HNH endonuclease [Pseudorhodobacter sp.]